MFKLYKHLAQKNSDNGSYCDMSLESIKTTKKSQLLLIYTHLQFICRWLQWDASPKPAVGGTSPHAVLLATSMASETYPDVASGTQSHQTTWMLPVFYWFITSSRIANSNFTSLMPFFTPVFQNQMTLIAKQQIYFVNLRSGL